MTTNDAQPASGAPAPSSRSHFIPFSKAELIRMLHRDGKLPSSGQESFREFSEILSALFHHQNHRRLEVLKETFEPLCPRDPEDPRPGARPPASELSSHEERFLAMLGEVLACANFTELSRSEIEQSVAVDSSLGIHLEVDLDAYQHVHVFHRKLCPRKAKVKSLFRVKECDTTYYDRVVLYIRFQERDATATAQDGKAGMPAGAHLKLFSQVPVNKLEMLFPNARMRMRLIDKLMIGVPAAASGILVLATKLGPTIFLAGAAVAFWLGLTREEVTLSQQHLVALGIGLVTLGAFLVRQLGKVKACRISYLRQLSENLFYRVLDNNLGVLHHLIGVAEDEEFKETLLVYYFLLIRERSMTEEEIDAQVEPWLSAAGATDFDFEVDDAARKLERLGLATRDAQGRLSVVHLAAAKEKLDRLWDDFFKFNGN